MASQFRDCVIPYGRTMLVPGDQSGASVRLRADTPLRLAHGPYPFPEPPDLIGIADTTARLDCLKELLQSQCGLWDKPARLFLDAYFARITAALGEGAAELAALANAAGGLFTPEDWSFCALRPLPQAHLPLSGGGHVRVDVAFWTGSDLVAIALKGSASPMKSRVAELGRVAAAGVVLVEVPALGLQHDGERLLARVLPQPFQKFWQGVTLPSSPFGPATLDEIRSA